MTQAGKNFMIGAIIVALAINVGFPLIWSCASPSWSKLIDAGGGSCVEFWLNRYQTLIAGLAALGGAWITIRTMQRQTETLRSDEADRRLSSYASALLSIMEQHENAKAPAEGESMAEAEANLRRLNDTTDGIGRQAMLDSIMGPDKAMVAMFINACRFSALGRVYGNSETLQYTKLTWPLYTALTNGIMKRRSMLSEGAKVSDLYTLSTIDHKEVGRAFIEDRRPDIV
jgi:hypothetical protein